MKTKRQHSEATAAAGLGFVDPRLVKLLRQEGVETDRLDGRTLLMNAVPLGAEFSKPRTNVLIKQMRYGAGANTFVDEDLAYRGDAARLTALLGGPVHKGWRKLCCSPLRGSATEVVLRTLEVLASPLVAHGRRVLRTRAARPADQPDQLGPLLSAVGRVVEYRETAAAHRATVRPALARQIAEASSRACPPRSTMLSGEPGMGCEHLMLAAAHEVRTRRTATQVVRLYPARLTAGNAFSSDVDAALCQLLIEAGEATETLLVAPDLDICLTGSPTSFTLLCDALDAGLRLIGSVRSEEGRQRMVGDAALARRLQWKHVGPLDRDALGEVAHRFAGASPLPVEPQAIDAAVRLAHRHDGAPARVLALLSAAIADAQSREAGRVGPDNVFAVNQAHIES